jgi:CRP-like cAMP-binding protein
MDSEGKDVFLNVAGLLNAFKQITTIRRIKLGKLMPGQIIGYEQAILGSNHRVTFETVSYSTLGQISQEDFNKVLFRFRSVRQNIIDCAANNKFDILKERFIEVARKSIPYFKKISENILGRIYAESDIKMYEYEQSLFKFGTKCDYIYFIFQGAVQIDVSNG